MKTRILFVLSVFLLLLLPLGQMKFSILPPWPLAGVQEMEPKPHPTLREITTKAFQGKTEKWFNQNYGLHDYLVKTDRQFYYTFFRDAQNAEAIILGKNHQLVNDLFIKKDLQFDPPLNFERVIQRLERINQLLKARGQTFVILVNPSKSAVYPGYIPDVYYHFPHFEPGANYRNFVDLARKAGLPLVDAKKLIQDCAVTNSTPFFPQGGIHWNEQASALAAQALLRKMEEVSGKSIGRIKIDSILSDQKPSETETDYARLLNLWVPPTNYAGVRVKVSSVPKRDRGKLSVILEGGSFSTGILDLYANLGLFKKITRIWYNSSFNDPPFTPSQSRDIGAMDWEEKVLTRNFVVLELYEINISLEDPDIFSDGFLKDLLNHLESRKNS